jgi:hypothetical protein
MPAVGAMEVLLHGTQAPGEPAVPGLHGGSALHEFG